MSIESDMWDELNIINVIRQFYLMNLKQENFILFKRFYLRCMHLF